MDVLQAAGTTSVSNLSDNLDIIVEIPLVKIQILDQGQVFTL